LNVRPGMGEGILLSPFFKPFYLLKIEAANLLCLSPFYDDGLTCHYRSCIRVSHAQRMFLNSELQFHDGRAPLGFPLVQRPGAEFAYSVFQSASRHEV